jgi:uncharacterized protein DUF2252
VLEPYAGKSLHRNLGQRVIAGQRLMQSASDIFLGWTRAKNGRDFLRSATARHEDLCDRRGMGCGYAYGRVCGWALARAYARSGDAAKIAGYMGSSAAFDKAMCKFAVDYADQNQRDYRVFLRAVRHGRLKAIIER